jgi:hypothetical protein
MYLLFFYSLRALEMNDEIKKNIRLPLLIYIFLFNDLSNRGKCIMKKTEREYTCMYVKVKMRSFSSVCVCVFFR